MGLGDTGPILEHTFVLITKQPYNLTNECSRIGEISQTLDNNDIYKY